MLIVLIQPPVQDFYETDVRLQPIGLAHLKAAAKKFYPHHKIIIRDYHQGGGRKTLSVPTELSYLKEYYQYADQSPFRVFHQYYHFGFSFEKIEEDLRNLKPDIVGISCLFTPYYREVFRIARFANEQLKATVLVGGSHVSACPEHVLAQPFVDYVIRGEGEKPFVEFLEYVDGKREPGDVSNLGWKKEGELVFNTLQNNYSMHDLPIADLSDLPQERYNLRGKPMTFMITSRSCPHRCTFCSVHLTFGYDYRRKSVAEILVELRLRYEQGYRVIDFEDDNLTFFRKEMKELCRAIISEFPPQAFELVAMNGISYLSLDEEMLGLMKEAGFKQLNLALVSSDKSVRETTKRPHTIEAYLQVVHKAHGLGLQIVSYQILGLPNETLESMIQTLAFNAQLPVLLGASPFYLTPNSPIAKIIGNPSEDEYFLSRLTAMAIETENFKRDDLFSLFVTTRILDFLKGLILNADCSIEEILRTRFADQRIQLGIDLLIRLFRTGDLFAQTTNGLFKIKHFKAKVFQNVWGKLAYVHTQNGFKISRSNTSSIFPQENCASQDGRPIVLLAPPNELPSSNAPASQ